jgi:transcriptional regulator with XRE-family HTH domain
MSETNTTFLPKRLREARGDRPLAAIGLAANVTENTVRNWEAGRTEPDASQLAAIAKVTGRSLDYFFPRRRAIS